MDPLTHALLGATVAQAAFGRRLGRHAWMIGAFGGVLPDADAVIGSASDPLLAIEYHRQFTHAFAFIPVGGLAAAAPWLLVRRLRENGQLSWRQNWRPVLAAATLGYATHGLLDACTNYGTHLLWPFSPLRVAWHSITTIGPLLTLILLVGLVFAVRRDSRLPAVVALVLGLGYVGAAFWQRESALAAQAQIAAARGHAVDRADMFPTVGNMLLWRSAYEFGGVLYTDRIRVPVTGAPTWKPGSSVRLLQAGDLPAEAQADERVRRDFARFQYFSGGWVARAVADPSFIGDARYSLSTETYAPIWGVRFHPGAAQPTEWVDHTAKNRVPVGELWRELAGQAPGYTALPARTSVPALLPAAPRRPAAGG